MIDVNFYTFRKRRNSTKRPAENGVVFPCEMKRNCSIVNPVLLIKDVKPTAYNYCYIPDFGRYYFITDWAWELGIWVATCIVDELASWKDYIGNSAQYVTRCAAAKDGYIIDTMYPTTANIETVRSEIGSPWSGALGGGTYVVGVIGQGPVTSGAVTYYAFSPGALASFISALLNSENIIGNLIQENPDFEISEQLATLILNPIEYISVCMWYPFSFGGGGGTMRVGWWDIPSGGSALPAEFYSTQAFSVTLPEHPQAATRGNYLNRSPFSQHTISVPPFGDFAIPEAMISSSGATTISCQIRVDLVTGTAYLSMSSGDVEGGAMIQAVGQVGITVPITALQSGFGKNVAGGAASAGTLAAGVAGGSVGGILSGVFGMVNSAIGAVQGMLTPTPTTVGAVQGSKLPYFGNNPFAISCYSRVVDADPEHFGNPYCKKSTISALPGYIKCENAEVDAPATEGEIAAIDGYLNGGFFFE